MRSGSLASFDHSAKVGDFTRSEIEKHETSDYAGHRNKRQSYRLINAHILLKHEVIASNKKNRANHLVMRIDDVHSVLEGNAHVTPPLADSHTQTPQLSDLRIRSLSASCQRLLDWSKATQSCKNTPRLNTATGLYSTWAIHYPSIQPTFIFYAENRVRVQTRMEAGVAFE